MNNYLRLISFYITKNIKKQMCFAFPILPFFYLDRIGRVNLLNARFIVAVQKSKINFFVYSIKNRFLILRKYSLNYYYLFQFTDLNFLDDFYFYTFIERGFFCDYIKFLSIKT